MRIRCKGCKRVLYDDNGEGSGIVFYETDETRHFELIPVKVVCMWCGREIDYEKFMSVLKKEEVS